MWPLAAADTPPALTVLADVWRGHFLEGHVIPLEAWRTPRAMVPRVVEADGGDVMSVQSQQPPWLYDIRLVCQDPGARTDTVPTCHMFRRIYG